MTRLVWRHRLYVLGDPDTALAAARARGLTAIDVPNDPDPCGCVGGTVTELAAHLTASDKARVVRWLVERIEGDKPGSLLHWVEDDSQDAPIASETV